MTLLAKAIDILVAGSDTTATTLAVAIQEMIRSPAVWKQLKFALREADIVLEQDYELTRLAQLPFLAACVKEVMRYAIAVPGRLPRVAPAGPEPFIVGAVVVPPGTTVGMSAYTIQFSESIWGKDSKAFNLDRRQAEDAKELDKHLVTCSKGVRQCLGINLAHADITITLAILVDHFRFSHYETLKESDLERIDNFTMGFRGIGIRAITYENKL